MGSPRGPRRPPWEFSWYLLFSLFFPLLGEARPGAPPGGCPFSTLTEAANHPGNRGHRCTKTQWVVSRAGSRCEPCRDAAGECARGFYWFWRAAAGRAGPWWWRSAGGAGFPRGETTEGFPQLVGFVARASSTVRAARCHLTAARGVPGGSFWCVHFELNRESSLNFPPDKGAAHTPHKRPAYS